MRASVAKRSQGLTTALVGFLLAWYLLFSISACRARKSDALQSDLDSIPYTSVTRAVQTLISDSGVTRYKLEAPIWYTYEQPESYWLFPDGIYVEQFDTLFHIQASIKADSAIYFQNKKLWELRGNVRVLNREGQRFYSESLFWDEAEAEVYSHDYIKIIRGMGQLIESKYGFRSNQNMTRYELYSSHGHLDVHDGQMAPKDSITSSDDASTSDSHAPDTLTPSTPDR